MSGADRQQRKGVAGGETILVADNHDASRKLTVNFLSSHGYAVLAARSVREALQIAKSHSAPIHLLVTDVVMPHMCGVELAKSLATLHPETKVIYMAPYADIMDFVRLGVGDQHDVISKPYMHHELMSRVRHVLRKTITH